MASKGPRPQSAGLRLIRGNPGRRPLPEDELQPKAELSPCPAHLRGEARKLYRTLGAELAAAGVLTALDRGSFAMLCTAWGDHVQAQRELRKWPLTSPEAKALSRISGQAAALCYRSGCDFGLAPGARHRPALADPPLPKSGEPSAWDQFNTGDKR